MRQAPHGARLALLGLLACGLLVTAPSAGARPAGVIAVSIVREAGTIVMQPSSLSAADGDTVRICNRIDVIVSLFSYSKYNSFGRTAGTGFKVAPGACTTLIVHNPTADPLHVAVFSEIQSRMKLAMTVAPACGTRTTQAAVKCARKTPATPPAGTFTLVSSKLTENPYGKEVTVDPGGSGTWNHCCEGATWKIQYTWKFPSTLTPGKPFSISMSLTTVDVQPSQPLADQMTALAPGFRQDLTTSFPSQPNASKTYSVPFSAGYKDDPNFKEIKLYVGFAHATVVFTYKRVGG